MPMTSNATTSGMTVIFSASSHSSPTKSAVMPRVGLGAGAAGEPAEEQARDQGDDVTRRYAPNRDPRLGSTVFAGLNAASGT